MAIAQSKITAQGQISVPALIRKKLGVGPGSVLEWDERGSEIVIRRARKYTFEDIHTAVFVDGAPRPRTIKEMKEGIRQHMRKRHARG